MEQLNREIDDDDERELSNFVSSHISRSLFNGKVVHIHIQKALKILQPREILSRDRARKHMHGHLPEWSGPITNATRGHDLIVGRFYAYKINSTFRVGQLCAIQKNGKIFQTEETSATTFVQFYCYNRCERVNGDLPFYFQYRQADYGGKTDFLSSTVILSEMDVTLIDDDICLDSQESQELILSGLHADPCCVDDPVSSDSLL